MWVIKRDGSREEFDDKKIISAVQKSAKRASKELTEFQKRLLVDSVKTCIPEEISVKDLHLAVERCLSGIDTEIAKSYKSYRDYKQCFVSVMDDVFNKSKSLLYGVDKENANYDSNLISTKNSLIRGYLTKEIYKNFFLSKEELQAIDAGFIYCNDLRDMMQGSINCCLFDMAEVLRGGFEMASIQYKEPSTALSALQVIGDVTLAVSAQQFGGFSVPECDKILLPYVMKSVEKYKKEAASFGITTQNEYVDYKVKEELRQGFQSLELKLNTVPSSRGDFAFTTLTFGEFKTDKPEERYWQSEICKAILRTRMSGHGKNHIPVVFPKLVYLYSQEQHDANEDQRKLFELAIECSSKAQYPDYLSLDGDGYVCDIYKKTGKIVSPMGCVDGKEVITYKYNGNLLVESFERMWERISLDFTPILQENNSDKYIKAENLKIFDSSVNCFVNVPYVIKNWSNDWYKVKLKGGRVITCTGNHPLPTQDGRKFVEDLVVGDVVPLISTQYSEESKIVEEDYAWLLGMIMCDGCYPNTLRISIAAVGENDIEQKIYTSAKKYFNLDMKTILQTRRGETQYKDVVCYGGSKNINKKCEILFGGKQKVFRHFPEDVFSWNEEARMAFLAGIVDADGYINNSTNGYSRVQVGSTNKELAIQQMLLANSLGLDAKMYENRYTKKNPDKIRYRVEFNAVDDFVKHMVCEKKKVKIKPTPRNWTFNQRGEVYEIEKLDCSQSSYDVTTESDKFDVSGVNSHNCRAYLSDFKGENGEHIFTSRANIGACALNLPMIWKKSEGVNFYEDLDYYLEMIREFFKKRYDAIAKQYCSSNPIAFCQGGLYKGHKKPTDKIGMDILKAFTASFGITALNELNMLIEGKWLNDSDCVEINKVVDYILDKISEFKKEDGFLYAPYGVPAESLAGTQREQFVKMFGVIPGVSDRAYFTNSFHTHVSCDLTMFEKQDKEYKLFHKITGGRIQYVRVLDRENVDAIRAVVLRGMKMGFYQGINIASATCEDCGHITNGLVDKCEICNSENLTIISRACGYLSFYKQGGDTRFNSAKVAEIEDRVSM